MLRAIHGGKTGLFLALMLVAVLLVTACTSKPTPTPAATPATKPAASPTAKPAAAPATKPAASPTAKPAAAPKETRIAAYAMGTGSTPYAMFHALADMVNKEHAWLRLDVREGTSAAAHLKLFATDAAKRKDTIVFSTDYANNGARKGLKPFDAPYEGARAIATYSWAVGGLVTPDPNIKVGADLKGKRVFSSAATTLAGQLMTSLIKDVWKIGDQVKISFGDYPKMVEALRDKLADVGSITTQVTPGTFEKAQNAAWATEMVTTMKINFFSVSSEEMVKAGEAVGQPIPYAKLPAGKMAPNQPEQYVYVQSMGWWADKEMDEAIVYEITKAIVENADRFKKYTAEGELASRKTLGMVPVPQEQFHPGALRYYKEQGLTVGAAK